MRRAVFIGELVTYGRKTNRPHRVKVAMTREKDIIYVSTANCLKRDWCKNILNRGDVRVKVLDRTFNGKAKPVRGEKLRVRILKTLGGPKNPKPWPEDAVIMIKLEK